MVMHPQIPKLKLVTLNIKITTWYILYPNRFESLGHNFSEMLHFESVFIIHSSSIKPLWLPGVIEDVYSLSGNFYRSQKLRQMASLSQENDLFSSLDFFRILDCSKGKALINKAQYENLGL